MAINIVGFRMTARKMQKLVKHMSWSRRQSVRKHAITLEHDENHGYEQDDEHYYDQDGEHDYEDYEQADNHDYKTNDEHDYDQADEHEYDQDDEHYYNRNKMEIQKNEDDAVEWLRWLLR